MKFKDLIEQFKDIGKLSDEELKKGHRLDKVAKDNFKEVDGSVFYNAIRKIRINDMARGDEAKGLDTLTIYDKSDYKKMKCYFGKNNSSGYCLKDKSELVSVFSSKGSSGSAIVQDAIRNGAKHLDCYAIYKNGKLSGDLYALYSRNGFKVDTSLNTGELGKPYSIQKGISRYVNDDEEVELDNPQVVIFMKI